MARRKGRAGHPSGGRRALTEASFPTEDAAREAVTDAGLDSLIWRLVETGDGPAATYTPIIWAYRDEDRQKVKAAGFVLRPFA